MPVEWKEGGRVKEREKEREVMDGGLGEGRGRLMEASERGQSDY